MPPKVADKLTDAERKKIKQANKAKANPIRAEDKAKTNLKRRIGRGQVIDPELAANKKVTKEDTDNEVHASSAPIHKPTKRTDAEKTERLRLKMLAIEKDFQEKQTLKDKQRIQDMLKDDESLDPEVQSVPGGGSCPQVDFENSGDVYSVPLKDETCT